MPEIEILHKSKLFKILYDEADSKLLNQYRWYIRQGYVQTSVKIEKNKWKKIINSFL